jgi:hypothetical protein
MTANAEANVEVYGTDEVEYLSGQLDELDGRVVEAEVGVTDTSDLDETNDKLEETETSAGDIVGNLANMALGLFGVKKVSDSFTISKELALANQYGGGTNQMLDEMYDKVYSLTTASAGLKQ